MCFGHISNRPAGHGAALRRY